MDVVAHQVAQNLLHHKITLEPCLVTAVRCLHLDLLEVPSVLECPSPRFEHELTAAPSPKTPPEPKLLTNVLMEVMVAAAVASSSEAVVVAEVAAPLKSHVQAGAQQAGALHVLSHALTATSLNVEVLVEVLQDALVSPHKQNPHPLEV